MREVGGLTAMEQAPHSPVVPAVAGKMFGAASRGWMAAALPEGFLTVEFPLADESRIAPGQAPVEVFCSSAPVPVCELEHHGEIKVLKPGQCMQGEETWKIIANGRYKGVEAQARFLQTEVFPKSEN